MGPLQESGRWLMVIGISVAVVGSLVWLAGRFSGLKHLPGTIRLEGQGFSCAFPLLGSILASIVLTILLNLVIRFINR